MSLHHLLAWAVILVGIPLNAYVTVRLWRLSRSAPDLRYLRERTVLALFVLILICVFGALFVNNDATEPFLAFSDTKLYSRLATLALAIVPASYWLWLSRGSEPET